MFKFKYIIIILLSQSSTSKGTCLSFSFYPNKIFAVYFSNNSLLLNISASIFNAFFFSFYFLICTFLILSSLISLSNSSTNSITLPKFSNPSQVSSSAIYSFYLTKYFSFSLTSCLFNIFSILYSFSLYISTRGGGIFFYLSTYS